jgi:biotin-dependent carboxylase-like uncharacterized protein
MITVENPGVLSLLQDLGRHHHSSLGVSRSGAADRYALALANRLLGNRKGAAAIETMLGGLVVTTDAPVWVAVTGAPTEVRVNDTPTASHTVIHLEAGDSLRVEPPPLGLRSYLAVRGGLKVDKVLGSRSTDMLSHIGPPPLTAGQQLPVGKARRHSPGVELAPPLPPLTLLQVSPGPRHDWFTEDAWQLLLSTPWTVTADSDRVALRLSGPRLERSVSAELPSEGLLRGAIQVPPSGQPLIFGPDHPVTGGYPVIAVLTDRASDHAAQARPGDRLTFTTSPQPTHRAR